MTSRREFITHVSGVAAGAGLVSRPGSASLGPAGGFDCGSGRQVQAGRGAGARQGHRWGHQRGATLRLHRRQGRAGRLRHRCRQADRQGHLRWRRHEDRVVQAGVCRALAQHAERQRRFRHHGDYGICRSRVAGCLHPALHRQRHRRGGEEGQPHQEHRRSQQGGEHGRAPDGSGAGGARQAALSERQVPHLRCDLRAVQRA